MTLRIGFWLAGIGGHLLIGSCAAAPVYHLQGTYSFLRRTEPRAGVPLQPVATRPFEVFVSNERYAIDTFDELNNFPIHIRGNSEETYVLVQYPTEVEASVDFSPVPRSESFRVLGVLWFALASGNFFATTVAEQRCANLKWALSSDPFVQFEAPASTFQIGRLPALPLNASMHCGGHLQAGGLSGTYAAPFDKGFEFATYETAGSKTSGELSFPATSTFRFLMPQEPATTVRDVVASFEYKISVDLVGTDVPEEAFRVATKPSVVGVTDYRLYRSFPINYWVTNNQWLRSDQLPKFSAKYQRKMEEKLGLKAVNTLDKLARLERTPPNAGGRSWKPVAVLSGVAVTAFALAWWMRRRRRK